MLEFPEAAVMSQQLNQTVKGKTVKSATAAQTPHKLTWYKGDPQHYSDLLNSHCMGQACGRGALVTVQVEQATLVFSDGVNLRFHQPGELRPAKHQLLIEFADGSGMSAVTQMYGGIVCFEGEYDNPYYRAAMEKPALLSPAFDIRYFDSLAAPEAVQKLSLKAFLATEQRIPGLGNGVLQDILFNAYLHPKKKLNTLNESQKTALFRSLVETLNAMLRKGGRDTEKDLLGHNGGYICQVSKNSVGQSCPRCGTIIKKEAYMGGSVYFCEGCQKI
jgi:formamidopyrimidine-DNA glycosylase